MPESNNCMVLNQFANAVLLKQSAAKLSIYINMKDKLLSI